MAPPLTIVTSDSDRAFAVEIGAALAGEFEVAFATVAPDVSTTRGPVLLLWSAALESDAHARGHALDAPALIRLWETERLVIAHRDASVLPLGTRDLPALRPRASADEIAQVVRNLPDPGSPGVSNSGAVLFVTVSEANDLYEEAGANQVDAAIRSLIEIVHVRTQRTGGRVLKTIGTDVMCLFSSPSLAAEAASEIQAAVATLPPLGATPLSVCAGFAYSHRLIFDPDGDVFGDSVNVAARLATMAAPGQILFTEEAASMLDARFRVHVRHAGATRSKTPIEVHELDWRAVRSLPAGTAGPTKRADEEILFVSYSHQDRELVDPVIAEIEMLGRPVWLDRRNLVGEAGWAGQIVKALRESRAVILMASPRSYASDQVVRELYVAMSNKKPIIPIEVEAAAMPDELQYILAPFQRHQVRDGELRNTLKRALASL